MTITVDAQDFLPYTDTVRSYSGRGMYGKYCLAVEFKYLSDFVQFVVDVTSDAQDNANNLGEFVVEEISNVSSDGMGLSTVYYWRGVEITNLDSDD